MNKFWNFSEDEMGRVLHLNGTIASESWVDDDVTPQIFKNELMSGSGPLTLWINSPGGDVFAAAQIYNMLMDYKDDVTVNIDGIAASAASVIAMAGTTVNMSPVAMMMIHNPMTVAIGDSKEMEKAIAMLSEVKESILNAYEIKTSLSRVQLSHLMDAESWFNAKKALELGFADSILYEPAPHEEGKVESMMFSRAAVTNQLLLKLADKKPQSKTPVSQLEKRLSLLK